MRAPPGTGHRGAAYRGAAYRGAAYRGAAILLVAAAISTAALALRATTPWGPAVLLDSTHYVAAARSLAAGDGLLKVQGTPFVEWPPLYPLALALGIGVGWDPWSWARWLSIGAQAAAVALSGIALIRVVSRPALVALGLVVIAVGPATVKMATWAMSEPLFTAIVGAWILALAAAQARGEDQPGRRRRLAAAAALAALAALARYLGAILGAIGVVVVATGLGAPARPLRDRRPSPARRLAEAALYGLAALLPLALWLVRNAGATGSGAGIRPPARPFADNLADLAVALADLALPTFTRTDSPWLVGLVLCVALGLAAGIALPRSRGSRGQPAAARALLMVVTLFAVVYPLAVVAGVSSAWSVRPNLRLLAPAFPALTIVVLAGAERWIDRWRHAPPTGRPGGAVIAAALLLGGFVAAAQATATASFVVAAHAGGQRYSSRRWRESPTLQGLARTPPPGALVANAWEPLYAHAGLVARGLPARRADLERWLGRLPGDAEVHVVWFAAGTRPEVEYGLADLIAHPRLHPVRRWSDGTLLRLGGRVSRPTGAPRNPP